MCTEEFAEEVVGGLVVGAQPCCLVLVNLVGPFESNKRHKRTSEQKKIAVCMVSNLTYLLVSFKSTHQIRNV